MKDQAERVHDQVSAELIAARNQHAKEMAEQKHEHSEAVKILTQQYNEITHKVSHLNKQATAARTREEKLSAEVEAEEGC